MASLIRFSQILCLSFMLLRFRVQSSSPYQSSPNSSPHLCRPEERSALLDFKSTTNLVERCPLGAAPRPIIKTWNESKDCCLWEGITCNKVKGHVIGLDLSSNCLKANLTANSSLFRLEKLQSLNLSYNYFHYPNISFGFNRWKGLQYLNLSSSAGSGPHVGYFNMDGSLLFGEIFLLSKLVSLDVSYHHGLLLDNIKFQMLEHNLTELRFLVLNYVNMSLIVPSSLLNLTSSLKHLSLWNCNLQGNIPNQIFQLPSLQLLDLSWNFHLRGNLPKSNQSSTLEYLNLAYTNFSGELPHSIGNLKLLKELNLDSCQFYGSIPRSLANLTEITQLDFSSNNLQGQIPDVFGKIHKLTDLRLDENNFGGEIPASIFNLTHLTFLSLSSNKLIGPLPHNILSPYLSYLNLRSNLLQGSLPILTTREYMEKLLISGNNLTGEIPSSYCNLTSLRVLILANNSLGGNIPECLGNLSVLTILDLQMNKFHGRIPNLFVNNSILLTLSLNGNQLEGILPQSLVNCSELEILDVENNNLNDTFPHWLGVLPSLKVLILRSNRFHGAISNSMPALYFPQLRIIDVAQNDFMGLLPSNYFKILKGMRDVAPAEKKYLDYIGTYWQCFRSEGVICLISGVIYTDSVKVVIKGLVMDLLSISKIFTIIDFSSNQFHGPIPEELGELNSLLLLNLSHNSLNGQIPSSLGKLAELESLDLSSNKLEGRIPEQLTMLTFLSSLNLSHNELVGHIPEGKQFSTFSNDSYVGNSGLCGFPLTKKCEEPRSPSSQFDEEDGSTAIFEWKFALAGYGCGLVLGLSMGYIVFTTGKPWWVVKKVEKYQQKLFGRYNRSHKQRKTQKPNQCS